MGFFEPPQLIEADVYAEVPAKLRKDGHPSGWIDANHPGARLGCFLEGPAFDREGNLYMVDIPYGRIFRMSPRGEFDVAAEYDGWPNGIVLDPDDKVLYVAMTRANCMWHCPLKPGGGVAKVGVFAQLPGIHGPDGLAMDEAGNLSAAHARPGIIWLLSSMGEPLYRVQSRLKGSRMTNMAYGGVDRKTLFITDSYNGAVLAAPMPVAGKVLFSHL